MFRQVLAVYARKDHGAERGTAQPSTRATSTVAWPNAPTGSGAPFALRVEFEVATDVLFDVDVSLDLRIADGTVAHHAQLRAAGWDPSWLPRGRYVVHVLSPQAPPVAGTLEIALWHHVANEAICAARGSMSTP